jgi:hypothetical protein
MGFIETVGTLTIASGSNYSNIISQSVFGKYDVLGIYPPSASTGTATLQVAPSYEITASATSWSVALGGSNTASSAITIQSGKTIFLESFPYELIRLSGSAVSSRNEGYIIKGQYMGALTGVSVLNT